MAQKEAESPERAAFTDHYDKLVEALPIVSLLPKFISKRIVTFSEQETILAGETDFEKRKRFLKHIKDHLSTGNTHEFNKFVDVVETHGGSYAYLATDIKQTIEEKRLEQVCEQEPFSVPHQETGHEDTMNVPALASNSSSLLMSPGGGVEEPRPTNEPADRISAVGNEEDTNLSGSPCPTLSDLIELVGSAASTKWYNLGLRLGVRSNILDRIEQDTRHSDDACRKMFQAWLKDKQNKTWNDVISALKSRSVGENSLADELTEKLITT